MNQEFKELFIFHLTHHCIIVEGKVVWYKCDKINDIIHIDWDDYFNTEWDNLNAVEKGALIKIAKKANELKQKVPNPYDIWCGNFLVAFMETIEREFLISYTEDLYDWCEYTMGLTKQEVNVYINFWKQF